MQQELVDKVVLLANEKQSRINRIIDIDDEMSRLRAEQDVCKVEIIEIDKRLAEL